MYMAPEMGITWETADLLAFRLSYFCFYAPSLLFPLVLGKSRAWLSIVSVPHKLAIYVFEGSHCYKSVTSS